MFNKLTTLIASTLLASVLVSTSASAATITQEILFTEDGTTEVQSLGSVTISTLDIDSFGDTTVWMDFSLAGFDLYTEDQADAVNPDFFGSFLAVANAADPMAGIEYLMFDVTEMLNSTLTFNGEVESGTAGVIDIFLDGSDGSQLVMFGDLMLGDVTVVPEPGTIALMALGLGVAGLRRKKLAALK